MRYPVLLLVLCAYACGASTREAVEPSPESSTDQRALMERFVAVVSSCEAVVRCCPSSSVSQEACEEQMRVPREFVWNLFEDSQALASGSARFDPDAIAALEEAVADCRPYDHGDALIPSLVIGTIAEGESCAYGNFFEMSACRDGLECTAEGVCSPAHETSGRDDEAASVESTYCLDTP